MLDSILENMSSSQIEQIMFQWVHDERNRKIMVRRIRDNITYESLGEEFDLTPQRIFSIIDKEKSKLYKHVDDILKILAK